MPLKNQSKKKYKKKKLNRRITPSYVMIVLFSFVFIFLGTLYFLAQEITEDQVTQYEPLEEQEFIVQIADYAKVLQDKYGILPSISIAQAILESDWGTSELSIKNNNYYGIKGGGTEPTITMTTKEFVEGEWIEVKADFRKYASWQESMEDHSELFAKGTTWNENQYAKVLTANDYKEAAYALQESGYATDPDYPGKLIRLIEQYQLDQYD